MITVSNIQCFHYVVSQQEADLDPLPLSIISPSRQVTFPVDSDSAVKVKVDLVISRFLLISASGSNQNRRSAT